MLLRFFHARIWTFQLTYTFIWVHRFTKSYTFKNVIFIINRPLINDDLFILDWIHGIIRILYINRWTRPKCVSYLLMFLKILILSDCFSPWNIKITNRIFSCKKRKNSGRSMSTAAKYHLKLRKFHHQLNNHDVKHAIKPVQ